MAKKEKKQQEKAVPLRLGKIKEPVRRAAHLENRSMNNLIITVLTEYLIKKGQLEVAG